MLSSNEEKRFEEETTEEVLNRMHEMGFSLIPCRGKTPAMKWKRFQSEQPSRSQLAQWVDELECDPDETINFGIVTGATPWSDELPGIVVVDCDDEEAVAFVEANLPPTPVKQITGSGGVHFAYRHPGVSVPNRQGVMLEGKKHAIDIRGDGGFIICPGSIHPVTGRRYTEVERWSPGLLKQAPVFDPEWLNLDDSGSPSESRSESTHHPNGEHSDELEQARTYLAKVPGTQVGDSADRKCSSLTIRVLHGFDLTEEQTATLLNEWGQRSDQLDQDGVYFPWSEGEIRKKVEWAATQEYEGQRGDRLNVSRTENSTICPSNHYRTAGKFVDEVYQVDGRRTLVFHRDEWFFWNGTHYELQSESDVKSMVYEWLDCQFEMKKEKRVPVAASRNLASGVVDALKGHVNLPSTIESPHWLDGDNRDVIAFENGLLDADTILNSKTDLISHTPNFFSVNCLPHDFDPEATCRNWLAFMNEIFDGDDERIRTLQMWIGYNLLNENRHHKIMMLIGPPRSGKGTTLAVMNELMGRHNVAFTSLSSLGGSFGLEPLVGKTSVFLDEGRLGRNSDNAVVLERLLAISGGSEQTVNRKNRAALPSVSLKTRFTMALNELPRLSDSSAALRSRLIILPYHNSYEGKEDVGLKDRLLREVSGITNWALDGLRHLMETKKFVQPSAGQGLLDSFEELSSPVKTFVAECCEQEDGIVVDRRLVRLAYQIWCEENGHHVGSTADLSRKLRAVVPRLQDVRPSIDGRRVRSYSGLALNDEWSNRVALV